MCKANKIVSSLLLFHTARPYFCSAFCQISRLRDTATFFPLELSPRFSAGSFPGLSPSVKETHSLLQEGG